MLLLETTILNFNAKPPGDLFAGFLATGWIFNDKSWQMKVSTDNAVVFQSLSHFQLFYNPMDCNLPGSSVHGISQARILGWVAMSFSRGSSWPRDRTRTSCIGRWVPYHWATREAINRKYLLKDNLECHQMITNHDQINKCQGEINGKTCIFFNYTTKAT